MGTVIKGIDFFPQTRIFWFQYLCNLLTQTFGINSLKYLRSTTLGYKDIKIRKSDFVAKTQLLWIWNISKIKHIVHL